MPNFLRQVLQTYSEETLIFLCTIKIVLLKQSAKIDHKKTEKSCNEIWLQCDEIHIIVNLNQKYEGDLRY